MRPNIETILPAPYNHLDRGHQWVVKEINTVIRRRKSPRFHVSQDSLRPTTYYHGSATGEALRCLVKALRSKTIYAACVYKWVRDDNVSHNGIVLLAHALDDIGGWHRIVIPDGFCEGYSGEGPRGMALARKLMSARELRVDDYVLSKQSFNDMFKPCHVE